MNYRNKTTGAISTQGEIRQANKHRSFPRVWDSDVCTLLDIDPVLSSPKPSKTSLQAVRSNGVTQDSLGNWVEAWELVDAFSDTTDEDGTIVTKATNEATYLASLDAQAASGVREQRNKLLAATDWTAGSDVTMSSAMTTYRTTLRDITTQEGFPHTITWPEEI